MKIFLHKDAYIKLSLGIKTRLCRISSLLFGSSRIRLKVVSCLTLKEKCYMSLRVSNGNSADMSNQYGDKRLNSLGSSWGTKTLVSSTSQQKSGDAKTIFVRLYITGRFSPVQLKSKKEPKHTSQTSTLNP